MLASKGKIFIDSPVDNKYLSEDIKLILLMPN
jgi:hypothetical protein